NPLAQVLVEAEPTCLPLRSRVVTGARMVDRRRAWDFLVDLPGGRVVVECDRTSIDALWRRQRIRMAVERIGVGVENHRAVEYRQHLALLRFHLAVPELERAAPLRVPALVE